MKLAMRLPEKSQGHANDVDPRDTETTEVIDLASRTSYPAVANRGGNRDALGLAAGVGFVALLGAATLWGLNASRMDDAAPAAAPAPAPVASPVPDAALVPVPGAETAVVAPQPDPAPAAVLAAAPQPYAGPVANPYNSPTLVFDGGTAPANAANLATAAMAAAAVAPEGAVVPGAGGAGQFAARIGGVGGGTAMATQTINVATTVTRGTMIPAILETAINTDVPGYVRAVVSQ
ncbi:MAG: type VI secretion protein, partial [Erythrobacter sp.]|nr:type VI secretion protein [Erythrobacter sp.]